MTAKRKSAAQKLAERWGLEWYCDHHKKLSKVAEMEDYQVRVELVVERKRYQEIWLALVKADKELKSCKKKILRDALMMALKKKGGK